MAARLWPNSIVDRVHRFILGLEGLVPVSTASPSGRMLFKDPDERPVLDVGKQLDRVVSRLQHES